MISIPNASITRMPGPGERYAVSTGGGTYTVDPQTGVCSCPAYRWRAAGSTGVGCKHGQALLDHLARERACPTCGGRGRIAPRIAYIGADGRPDTSALPCAACNATGLRVDPRETARQRDADLRKLFG